MPPQENNEGERGGGMADFAVVERGEFLARRLVTRFGPAAGAEACPDLLVIGPGLTSLNRLLTCRMVLLPGDQGGLLGRIEAKSAVSYGLSGRDEMTQKEVADVLGISQSYISRLEKRILQRLHGEIVRQSS